MSNGCDVADASDGEAATSVYPEPIRLMLKSGNVAIPFTAFLVSTPESVALDGLLPSEIVTGSDDVVSVVPNASWMATVTAGLMVSPALADVGCCTNATLTGTAAPPVDVFGPAGSNTNTLPF